MPEQRASESIQTIDTADGCFGSLYRSDAGSAAWIRWLKSRGDKAGTRAKLAASENADCVLNAATTTRLRMPTANAPARGRSVLDRKGCLLAALFFALAAPLTGCLYESEVTRQEYPGGRLNSPDPDRYGALRLVWVREYRAPWWLFKFPDGGKPFEVAMYANVYQSDGEAERVVGRIELQPVRRGDFGNPYDATFTWPAPHRLSYRVTHGYRGHRERTDEGELEVPPLP